MQFVKDNFLLLIPWQVDITSDMRLILSNTKRYLGLLPAESCLKDWELGQERGLRAMSNRLHMVNSQILVENLLKKGNSVYNGTFGRSSLAANR